MIIKKFLFVFLLSLISEFSFSQSSTDNAIASCCENKEGRCVGSASCRVCTNCSSCGYCKSGGSCGVCSSGQLTRTTNKNYYQSSTSNSNNYQNSSRTIKTYSKNNFNLPDDPSSEYYLKTLMVNINELNLRSGPSTDYKIIEKSKKNQELIFLAMTGDWIKVRIKSSSTVGFVNFKYIVVLTD